MRKLAFLFLSVFISTTVIAQVTTSSINGIVTDEQGQSLIGATLKAIHLPTERHTPFLLSKLANTFSTVCA